MLGYRKGGGGGVLILTGEQISELMVFIPSIFLHSLKFSMYGEKILVRQICIPLLECLVCGDPSSSSLPGVPETHLHPCHCWDRGCCGTGLYCVTLILGLWRGCIWWAGGAAHLQVVSACEICSSSPVAFSLQ